MGSLRMLHAFPSWNKFKGVAYATSGPCCGVSNEGCVGDEPCDMALAAYVSWHTFASNAEGWKM